MPRGAAGSTAERAQSRDDDELRARVRRAAGGVRRLGAAERRDQGGHGPAPLRARDARRRAAAAVELLLPRPRHGPARAVRRAGARDRARPPRRRPRRGRRRRHGPRRAGRRRRDVDRRRRPAAAPRPRALGGGDHGRRPRRRRALLLLEDARLARRPPGRELPRARRPSCARRSSSAGRSPTPDAFEGRRPASRPAPRPLDVSPPQVALPAGPARPSGCAGTARPRRLRPREAR